VGDVPLEISAVRLSDNRYIVKSLASTYGELDWETVSEYQLVNSLIALGIIGVCSVGFLIFFILAIRNKR
jgi:hypothetical protein